MFQRIHRILGVLMLVLLLCVGVLLFADWQFTHQIYPISESMINNATDSQTKQYLIEERNRRNREERIHKNVDEIAIGIDLLLLLFVAGSLLRRFGPATESKTSGAVP